ncbi:MAG TPA: metallophosphoesterase [Gemmatimonadaceae bacterium]|nr:metallophosphoesterase [Gemmatimonadaceae bacterium]
MSDRGRRPFRVPPRALLKVALYFVACWSVLALLVSDSRAALAALLALALYTTIPLLVFLRWGGWPFYPGKAFRLFVLRVFWYAQLALPLVAGAGLVGLLAGAPFGRAMDVGRIAAATIAGTLTIFIGLGYLGSRALVVRDVLAELPDLPAEFEGFRIVQLTDLHIGPHLSRTRLDRVAQATSRLEPHMIAVTGDIVDDRVEDLEVYREVFGGLRAEFGVFLIPGNHDVYAGWPAVERRLRRGDLGILLVNESYEIRRGPSAISVVGTGDPAGRGFPDAGVAPDIDRALAGVPAGRFTIALAHNPALFKALAERGVALTLSGHTHWGQLALPNAGWSMAGMFLEDAMGVITRGRSLLYISPGTGYWGIPFRIGATGEVTHFTLTRGKRDAPHGSVTGRRTVAC